MIHRSLLGLLGCLLFSSPCLAQNLVAAAVPTADGGMVQLLADFQHHGTIQRLGPDGKLIWSTDWQGSWVNWHGSRILPLKKGEWTILDGSENFAIVTDQSDHLIFSDPGYQKYSSLAMFSDHSAAKLFFYSTDDHKALSYLQRLNLDGELRWIWKQARSDVGMIPEAIIALPDDRSVIFLDTENPYIRQGYTSRPDAPDQQKLICLDRLGEESGTTLLNVSLWAYDLIATPDNRVILAGITPKPSQEARLYEIDPTRCTVKAQWHSPYSPELEIPFTARLLADHQGGIYLGTYQTRSTKSYLFKLEKQGLRNVTPQDYTGQATGLTDDGNRLLTSAQGIVKSYRLR